jgi:hypothetical protein
MKTPRTKADIRKDPRVQEFWHEPENENYWVVLRHGYYSDEGTSAINGRTVAEVCADLALVTLHRA